MTDRRSRSDICGFSLAEVIVALLLLSIGLFGLTTAAAWSARTTRAAAALESAVASADEVLDSLAFTDHPNSDRRVIAGDTLEWIASTIPGGTRIDLRIGYFDGSVARSLQLNARTLPFLPEIDSR